MENAMHATITERIDEHLGKYRALLLERIRVEGRLAKAESEKDSVKSEIFDKVRDEYKTELERLQSEIVPVENEIEDIRSMIRKELRSIGEKRRELADQIEEFDFRYRVGEFTSDDLTARRDPIEDQERQLEEHKKWLEEQMQTLDINLDTLADSEEAAAEPDDIDAAADDPVDESQSSIHGEGADAELQLEEEEEPVSLADEEEDENLENPSEWTKEFVRDTFGRRSTDKTSDTLSPADDPLEALSEPAPEKSRKKKSPKQTSTATKEPPKSFPVLIITKGGGAGKKLPLVPMTMTIGREHDNNIELKDEEVARYHARIAYERGEYFLQDLESASGTFVNDKAITKATALQHGDKIRVGGTEMMIDFE